MVTLTDLKEALREILGFGTGEIGREGVAAALGDALDLHSSFTWVKYLAEGLDAHFNARTVALDGTDSLATPSDYWIQELHRTPWTGYITNPSTLHGIGIYSKRAFRYPVLSFRAIIPTILFGSSIYVGFENGSMGGNGLAFFMFHSGASYVVIGSFGGSTNLNITGLLPADFRTALHTYTVELNKTMAVFYVDNVAIAYGLITPNSAFTAILGPPYGLFSTENPVSPVQSAFAEVVGAGNALRLALPPIYFRVSDGDPLPPKVIRLYDAGTNTLFAGLTIAAGSETSHPVPVFGYDTKTFHFRASQAGTLLIEVLMETNNWRTYDTLPVAADTPLYYSMYGQAVLTRITFTPSAYPCTISEAEAVMS